MLRKRLLAAVIVKNGLAVQSFSYKRYLPLGDPRCLVENLDRWGADGIVVQCIDRDISGPNLELLRSLSKLQLSTPLTYGGGIRTPEHALATVQAGAERLVLDRVLTDTPEKLRDIASAVGRQALIASIPLCKETGGVQHLQYWNEVKQPLQTWLNGNQWQDHVSELLSIDVSAEGSQLGPDPSLWRDLYRLELPILSFGGFSTSEQIEEILQIPGIAAAVIGNALSYKENGIRSLKDKLRSLPLRPHPTQAQSTVY